MEAEWMVVGGVAVELGKCGCIFVFQQMTAYELLRSLVGSEIVIRDR